jgi:hypothetical protein
MVMWDMLNDDDDLESHGAKGSDNCWIWLNKIAQCQQWFFKGHCKYHEIYFPKKGHRS